MEAIGVAIGVVGLSTVLATTVRNIRKTVQDIQYARDDLHDVEKEARLFARLYDDFLDVCDEASSITGNALKIKQSLISWTENTIKGFQDLFDKVQAVARNPEYYYSLKAVAKAYYNWIRSKGTVKYLRASLSVARQSMILFTNVRNIEMLNEELVHLRSSLSPAERESIELRRKMTVEERIRIVRRKCRNRHSQRRDIEKDLNEAVKELAVQQEEVKDTVSVPRTEPLLQFQGAVNRYVDHVYFQERTDRRAYRSQRGSSSLPSSQSTATTPTRSTQSSNNRTPAPESPPTSPEPHNSPQQYVPSEWGSHIDGPISPVIIPPHLEPVKPVKPLQPLQPVQPVQPVQPLKSINNRTRGRACSCPVRQQTQRSSKPPLSPLNSRREMDKSNPTEPSTQPIKETSARTRIQPVTVEENEEDSQDETSEEGDPTNELAGNAGPSIWQATGAFEGNMPRGLSIRRQRSRSPQDFW